MQDRTGRTLRGEERIKEINRRTQIEGILVLMDKRYTEKTKRPETRHGKLVMVVLDRLQEGRLKEPIDFVEFIQDVYAGNPLDEYISLKKAS